MTYVKSVARVVYVGFKTSPEARARGREKERRRKHKDPIGYLCNSKHSKCRTLGKVCTFTRLARWDSMICQVCGVLTRPSVGKRDRLSPSLDCVDPLLGYIEGNVDMICWGCNDLKRWGRALQFMQLSEYVLRDRTESDTLLFRPS